MKKLALERSTRPLYDMPAPNAGLSRRGKLPDLYRNETQWAFRAENTADTWLDPALLEDALDCDEKLHGLLVEVLAALVTTRERAPREQERIVAQRLERFLARIDAQVERVFEQRVLVDIARRFASVKRLVTLYIVAKAAQEQQRSYGKTD